jgi:hypothetical protein
LHPFAQVVVAGVGHWPLALHEAAAVRMPDAHDCPEPQAVPADLLVLSTHIELPVAHDVVPFLQALAG